MEQDPTIETQKGKEVEKNNNDETRDYAKELRENFEDIENPGDFW